MLKSVTLPSAFNSRISFHLKSYHFSEDMYELNGARHRLLTKYIDAKFLQFVFFFRSSKLRFENKLKFNKVSLINWLQMRFIHRYIRKQFMF